MTAIAPLDSAVLEGLARAIGEAFTGSTVDGLISTAQVPIRADISTKWRRVLASFEEEQERSRSAAAVLAAVKAAGSPARWSSRPTEFEAFRTEVNVSLAFAGLSLRADGHLIRRAPATTLSEAAALTRRLRDEVQRRGGHAMVFEYCNAQLLANDCFDAVFEALKGMCDRLREMTGLDLDGWKLFEAALEGEHPKLALNSRATQTQRNEQRGVSNLAKGLFSTFRAPAAHEVKLFWHLPEADALDLLCTLSLIHRRLDAAVVIPTVCTAGSKWLRLCGSPRVPAPRPGRTGMPQAGCITFQSLLWSFRAGEQKPCQAVWRRR